MSQRKYIVEGDEFKIGDMVSVEGFEGEFKFCSVNEIGHAICQNTKSSEIITCPLEHLYERKGKRVCEMSKRHLDRILKIIGEV